MTHCNIRPPRLTPSPTTAPESPCSAHSTPHPHFPLLRPVSHSVSSASAALGGESSSSTEWQNVWSGLLHLFRIPAPGNGRAWIFAAFSTFFAPYCFCYNIESRDVRDFPPIMSERDGGVAECPGLGTLLRTPIPVFRMPACHRGLIFGPSPITFCPISATKPNPSSRLPPTMSQRYVVQHPGQPALIIPNLVSPAPARHGCPLTGMRQHGSLVG